MKSTLAAVLVAGLLAVVEAKRDTSTCPSDPYASPTTDHCNPLRYIPNLPINIVAGVLYFIVAILLSWRLWKQKANYFICLVVGAYCEAIGLFLRIGVRNDPHSQGIYIAMYMFVVLSPCAFLAGNYILLGRIVDHLGANRHLRPLKARLVSWIFIISDVITFLIQAAGGGLSTADDPKMAQTGSNIFLAGIAAQMGSFTIFSGMWVLFLVRVLRSDQILWKREGWKSLFFALGLSSVCFMVRSVYRTVELSEGYIGFLATHERYFLGLDTLPLLLGIAVYIYYWPGKYLTPDTKVVGSDSEPQPNGEMRERGGDGVGERSEEATVVDGLEGGLSEKVVGA